MVGEIGDDMHMEYLAIGDAVNVAARLQSAAKPGKVLLSEACARLVGEAFGLKTLGDIQVKGKAEALAAYEVVEARAPTVVRRGIERFQAPYIGRGREVEQLQSVLLALCEGHGQIVALVGEAGIGKTRLLEEVKALVCQGESDAESTPISPKTIRWLEGRSVSYGGSLSYWAITQLLLEDLGLSEGAPQVKIKVALRRRVKDLFGEEKSDDLLPYLSHLLGLTQEGEAEELIQSLDGESLKRGTLTSVQDYFASVAKERPTVLVFEDMHWADSSSLEALESLLAPTDLVPLMILMLMRIERDHGSWGVKIKAETDFPHRYTDVHLGRLSDADSSELMVHLLGADELLEELRSMIMARSEGNPFYLEEVTRHLVEEGLIVRDEEGWRATEAIGEIGIPETLHGVLLARIDRLEEDVRRTLQMASVVGKSFLYRILEAISEVERQLDEHLSQLQRVDLVREKARIPELEYMFKHTLTQEAAYNSLLHARRKEFHWKVGEALEKLFADREEDFLGILAHHFEAAEVHDKAVDYLIRAGDRARLAYAHQEAIDSYQRALSLLEAQEEYERMARTLMKLGLTYHNSFDFHRASKAYEEGFAMWKQAAETQPVISVPPAPHALRLGWIEPRTLDPTMAFETASIPVTAQLFSGLVQLSPDLEILPDVAHSWEVLDAGRRYVFHLREDVCWSDGEPVTAKDFEFGWKHVLNPATESPCAYLLYDVKGAREFHEGRISYADYAGVRAIDDVTLCAELEEPTSYFMQLLSLPPFYPLPRHVVEVYGKMWSDVGTIVTNGPFMVVEWKPGESIVLARNPAYHGRCMGNVQEVRLIPKRGWSAELGMYEADDLDSLDIRRYPWKELERIRQRYAGEYVIFPAHSTFYLGFNVKQSPFHDVCVRQAFVMALDREMLASMLAMDHFSPITGGFVPPGMPGYSAGITLPYDPDRARQLLAGSGYPGGRGFPKVELLLIPHYRASEIGEFLQMQWREYLAVEILWEVQEWGKFMERLQDKP
ncbi:MAG: AAA family ATPase, partial [Anaerolineales bacterium]|nr:AAA family ATPase [Anaerolineales bacterium]